MTPTRAKTTRSTRRYGAGRVARWAGIGLVGLAVLGAGLAAQARMYQWVSPKTGRAQLSGTPPSWYRSEEGGPRVLVFENGVLVDDTSLRVSLERQEALRQAAFEEAERRQLAALQRLEEAARRESERAEGGAAGTPRAPRKQAEAPREEPPPERLSPLEQFGVDTIERLKALVAEFDRAQGAGQEPPAEPEQR